MKRYRVDFDRKVAGSVDIIAESAEEALRIYEIALGDETEYDAEEWDEALSALGDEDIEIVDQTVTGVFSDEIVTPVSYQWSWPQFLAVKHAFEAWAENQWDDMQAGGGQTQDDIESYDYLQSLLEAGGMTPPPLDALHVELLKNAVWNAIDTPDAFEPEFIDPDDLRSAVELAGWTDLLEGGDT